jgi:MFS transporter, DHA1 family, tetracycline resistance protein
LIANRSCKHAAYLFIAVTVLLDGVCFGIVLPVLPGLLVQLSGVSVTRASIWIGLFGATFSLAQFLCAPLQGALSDRFGRRVMILSSNAGMTVNFAILAATNSFAWLFIGRVVLGITAASLATANAYIADITPASERTGAFAKVGGAFGIGLVLGPAIGGLLGGVNLRLPFIVAAAVAGANLLYGFFILPESLDASLRAPGLRWLEATPLGSLMLLFRDKSTLALGAALFLIELSSCAALSLFVLYVGYRFHWSPQQIGWILLLVGILQALTRLLFVEPAVRALGERFILRAGLASGALAFAVMGCASSGALFLTALPLYASSGASDAPLQAMLSRRVSSGEQGRLQAALASLTGIAGVIGPLLFTQLFALSLTWKLPVNWATHDAFDGAAFGLASLSMCGALLAAIAGSALKGSATSRTFTPARGDALANEYVD